MSRYRVLLLPFIFALLAAAVCRAEEADEKNVVLEPVTVTANKREEDIQEVPSSITVIDAIDMDDALINSFNTLADHVPNFHFYDWGANSHNFVFMRGIGAVHNEPAVGVYLDGVGLFETGMFNYPLYDAERIEVLRGPQGTLYGRNALGGVVNIITREPGNETVVEGSAGVGNYGMLESNFFLSVPVVEDKVFLSASGFAKKRDGYQENTSAGFTGDEGDHNKGFGGRVKMLMTPHDNLELIFHLDGQKLNGGSYPVRRMTDWAATGLPADDPHTYSHNYEENKAESNTWGSSFSVKWDTLHGSLASITGLRMWDNVEINDQDFSPLDVTHFQHDISQQQYSQELRFASHDGSPFRWLAGAYGFYRDKTEDDTQFFDSAAALFGAVPGTVTNTVSDYKNYGFALFGEATYTVFGDVDLTAGLRYERETSDYGRKGKTFVPGPGWTVTPARELDAAFDAILPKFSFAWRVTDAIMPYATAARGFRSGGFNSQAPSAAQYEFAPEYTWNYELGVKSQWWSGRATLNLAAYYIDIEDQQLSFVMPLGSSKTYVTNAGESNSRGVEVESQVRVLDGLDFIVNASYSHTEFEKYSDSVSGDNYKGNTLPMAPVYDFNLALQYRDTSFFSDDANIGLFARVDLIGVGTIYWDAANSLEQKPYELVNCNFGVEGEHLDFNIWVKNIFDVEYTEMSFQRSVFPVLGQDGPPRTLGATLSFRF